MTAALSGIIGEVMNSGVALWEPPLPADLCALRTVDGVDGERPSLPCGALGVILPPLSMLTCFARGVVWLPCDDRFVFERGVFS